MLYILVILVFLLLIFLLTRTLDKSTGSQHSFDREFFDERSFGEITNKGHSLESYVERKLRRLEQAGGRTIKNCYLSWNNGSTTEIDDILIFRSGIYVIECKDYSGWIFGNSSQEYWTQTLPYGYRGAHTKRQFYNPIRQNQNHIACVRQKLRDYPSISLYNIVVFGDGCTFKSFENDSTAHVIRASRLYKTIWEIEQHSKPMLSQPDIDEIYHILSTDVSPSYRVKHQHIKNVERIKQQKYLEKFSTGDTCPRCGAQLVLRNGRYGIFYGCSNYPSCKYIRKTNW